ncbi:MAG: TonB-dependent receptor, partial [Bacteroidales bacterium]|nr:TonB-dependent receptor [Bacteroidales bacterium]
VWYSSSDAFFMYQDGKDRKLYTAEANPFLVSDTLVVSSAERPPMGIEGTEHISAQQKIFIDPCDGLSILAYGSYFFMNSYDLVQDMIFSQSEDWTVGGKLYWTFKDWFKLTLSMHADFYERFKRHERVDRRLKVYDSKIIQPRLSLSSSYFDGHELILGVEGISDDLVSDRFNGDASHTMRRRTLRETEYFIQDEWAISPQWMLSAGVRSNFSKAFGLMAMPKLAVKWTASPVWAFRANYSMGYRSPSIKELFFNWDHLGMFMIKGNESLQPEKNNYFSLGAEFSDDSFFLSANAYANVFHDKIEGVWRVYDMQYNFEYTNLSSQRLLGVEALLRWHFLDRFTLNGTYSYVDVSSLDGIRV